MQNALSRLYANSCEIGLYTRSIELVLYKTFQIGFQHCLDPRLCQARRWHEARRKLRDTLQFVFPRERSFLSQGNEIYEWRFHK